VSVAPSSAPAPSSRRADPLSASPDQAIRRTKRVSTCSIDTRDDRARLSSCGAAGGVTTPERSPDAKTTRAIGSSGSTDSPVVAPAASRDRKRGLSSSSASAPICRARAASPPFIDSPWGSGDGDLGSPLNRAASAVADPWGFRPRCAPKGRPIGAWRAADPDSPAAERPCAAAAPDGEVLERMFGMSPSRRNAVKVAENLSQAKISRLCGRGRALARLAVGPLGSGEGGSGWRCLPRRACPRTDEETS